ncbi:MAG: EF-hand domain-containing protein [Cyanobacteria bacterium P01_F01_bin.143]
MSMSQKKIVNLFYDIDKNSNGYISGSELVQGVSTNEEFKEILKLSGEYEDIAKRVLATFDKDFDSKIDLPEFMQMIRTLESA